MIADWFAVLGRALDSTPALALGAAFLWGVLSILLSPCHLGAIPLIVAFIGRQGRLTTAQACFTATSFAVGILVTIALIGVATALAGRLLGDLGPWGNYLVAGIFLAVGLHLWEALPMPWAFATPTPRSPRRGYLAASLLGLIFGLALGPCTFAYLAPVLALSFTLAASQTWYGGLLLLAYALGHCALIVLAGTAAAGVQRYLDWSARSPAATVVKRLCGLGLIVAGLYLIWVA